MHRSMLSGLAVLASFIAGPSFADSTDEQRRLLNELPSVDQVLAATPKRADAVENAMLRETALFAFEQLASSLAPKPRSREVHAIANRYWAAYFTTHIETLRSIGAYGVSAQALRAGEKKLTAVRDGLFSSREQAFEFRRKLFEDVLEGDLEDYALDWHDDTVGELSRPAPRNQAEALIAKLPAPVRNAAHRVLALPRTFWITLLVVWLVLGIAFRTAPFGLSADDPWILQRGRKRRRMAHHFVTVANVQETLHVIKTKRQRVNVYGMPDGASTTSTSQTRIAKLFVRVASGQEDVIQLVDRPFDVREGHRLLAVFDDKSRRYCFLYNCNLDKYLEMPDLRRYVKMRPFILIPVWVLATLLTLAIAPSGAVYVFYGTPIAYLILIWSLNTRRVSVFMKKLAPRIVEAADHADTPRYIDNSRFGAARAS